MKYVIQIYSRGNMIGWLKSVNAGSFAITKDVKNAKRFDNIELAHSDCDHIASCTNGQSIGSVDRLL